jgi:hypothetical protein
MTAEWMGRVALLVGVSVGLGIVIHEVFFLIGGAIAAGALAAAVTQQLADIWSRPGRRGNAARKSTTSHEPEVIETRRGGDHLPTPSAAPLARLAASSRRALSTKN